ncbi:cell division protein FtsQ/DivIB [Roseivirga sp. BDSF3-8]|uniref:cell division protein FtsQ/DivIB n=1 Tax=Roseivirga sp. BDSF3-8 TaxID=3241598 RepID=UPI0035322F53
MKLNKKTGNVLKALLLLVLLSGSIGFVEKKAEGTTVNNIFVEIDKAYDNYFVEEADVHALIQNGEGQLNTGVSLENVKLKDLEAQIRTHDFVKDAQVYKDLKGNLVIRVQQNRPLARLMRADGPDAYISADGELLPVSARFTARVPVITGSGVTELIVKKLDTETGKELVDMLSYIDRDPFWVAQVAGLEIDREGEMILYPQVTKQIVEFGTAAGYRQKLKKLRIFYKDVLPRKGWNHYERVSLKYENQIVCE